MDKNISHVRINGECVPVSRPKFPYINDTYSGMYDEITVGDSIRIEYGYGMADEGMVYGKFTNQWEKHLRVKIQDGGRVRWEMISGIANFRLGIGSYWTPDSPLRKLDNK